MDLVIISKNYNFKALRIRRLWVQISEPTCIVSYFEVTKNKSTCQTNRLKGSSLALHL